MLIIYFLKIFLKIFIDFYSIIYLMQFFEIFACIMFFSWRMRKKSFYLFRLILLTFVCVYICFILAFLVKQINNPWIKSLNTLLLDLYMLGLLFFCYKERISYILLTWCMALASREIVDILFTFALLAFGINNRTSISFFSTSNFIRDAIIYDFAHIAPQIALAFFFRIRNLINTDSKTIKDGVKLSVITILICCLIKPFATYYETESKNLFVIAYLFDLILASMILAIKHTILSENKYRKEIRIIDLLLLEKRKQYEINKSNINYINIKFHDIKHQLEEHQSILCKQELDNIRNSMSFYERAIKTGNNVLDIIIYEKQINCEKYGIILSYMINGKILDFISTTNLYALFSNALGNAVQATSKLDILEKRIIGISVIKDGKNAIVVVYNYFQNITNFPAIERDNDINSFEHGYGLKSIQYICNIYHGNSEVEIKNDMFFLKITIPIPI